MVDRLKTTLSQSGLSNAQHRSSEFSDWVVGLAAVPFYDQIRLIEQVNHLYLVTAIKTWDHNLMRAKIEPSHSKDKATCLCVISSLGSYTKSEQLGREYGLQVH